MDEAGESEPGSALPRCRLRVALPGWLLFQRLNLAHMSVPKFETPRRPSNRRSRFETAFGAKSSADPSLSMPTTWRAVRAACRQREQRLPRWLSTIH